MADKPIPENPLGQAVVDQLEDTIQLLKGVLSRLETELRELRSVFGIEGR